MRTTGTRGPVPTAVGGAPLAPILSAIAEAVLVFRADGSLWVANSAAEELFGADALSLRQRRLGDPAWGWRSGTDPPLATVADPAEHTLSTGQPLIGRQISIEVDGELTPVSITTHPFGSPEGVGVVVAVTDLRGREVIARDLGRRAMRDALTGLPNRVLLQDRLDHAIGHAARSPELVAVVFLDLDHFKRVNDELGHDAGDRLLSAVGERLVQCVRPGDTVARLGGDEFVVLYEGLPDEQAVDALVERLRLRVAEAVEVRGPMGLADISTTASFGVVVTKGSSTDSPADLLRRADLAMYEAKTQGRNQVCWFDAELQATSDRRLHLETDLVEAIDRGELTLDYQPIVDLRDRSITGYEALVRWHHPRRGLLHPVDFVSVAERTGLIVPIGETTLREALAQKAVWDRSSGTTTHMSVNVSSRHFGHGVAATLEALVDRYDLDPESITIELTETLLLEPPRRVLDDLHAVRSLGALIALDDFGTGFSPLTHLTTVPIDIVKIDRSLVTGSAHDATKSAVGEAIVSLAHALDLRVVAEGIEIEDELDHMLGLGVTLGQGYLFGRPAPASEISH